MCFHPATRPRSFALSLALCSLLFFLPQANFAQSRPALISQPINNSALVTLPRNVHPLARPEYDRGAAPPSLPLNRMLLVLKRSPAQQSALDSLIAQQQNKNSSNYHQWLTPQQFGQQFGPADSDIATIQSWLASYGFHDIHVSSGRTYIEFSGSAAQVQAAFHTAIHHYVVAGVDHWANATNPQIPAALAPAVDGVATLHNFFKQPQLVVTDKHYPIVHLPNGKTEVNISANEHAIGPGDFSVIYNVNPVYQENVNGAGRTIAVVGRSNIDMQDVIDFRNLFEVSGPTPNVIVNGTDPGNLGGGEQIEATLDLTWSSSIALGAQTNLVVSASTNTTDGVDLSEAYIVDNDLGDIMTESFSGCEASVTQADADQISALAEQAAAEGITYMVSTGDSGAEGCDNPNIESHAIGPISVNVLASSPYTVAVGGTVFNEGSNPSAYWGTNQTSLTTALSYIPEQAWNDSCATNCGLSGPNIWAGSGGASTFFSKPVWQASVAGIPQDNARDLPDVSLTAAPHDGYVLCVQSSCEQGEVLIVGGTSASTPSFAGIMALVDQQQNERQGQADFVLYRLAAAETYANCNGSSQTSLPASTCIFNDPTVGNNAVPGESGYGTPTADYQTGVGYDLATGLGSVNVANLVNGWDSARSESAAVTLTLNPSGPITHGTSVTMNVNVAPAPPATTTPTGDIAITGPSANSPSSLQPFANATLDGNGNATATTDQIPGGTVTLTAHYEGDGTYVPGDATAQLTVNPESSTTSLAVSSGGGSGPAFSAGTYGTPLTFSSTVAGSSGVGTPSGLVIFQEVSSGAVDAQATLNPSGVATASGVSNLSVGTHTLAANYQSDPSFQASSSTPVTFNISQASSATNFNPSTGSLIADASHYLQILVAGTGQGASPTGTITLQSGSNPVGNSLALSPNGTASSIANFSAGSLPYGPVTLTATYSGDTNYIASAAAPATFNVVRPTSTAVSSSNPSIIQGASVSFTATVTPGQAGPALTGTVQFFANGNSLGSAVTVGGNGQAQTQTTMLPVGNVQINAVYSGDSNYGTSTASLSESVAPAPSVLIAAAPSSITVNSPGQSGSTTLTFTGQNNFLGTINFSPADCSGLPSEASCRFSTSSVTLNSSTQSASVVLTVSTTAPSLVSPMRVDRPASRHHALPFAGIIAFAFLFWGARLFNNRKTRQFVGASLVVLALVAISSCGGGSSGPSNPGTPTGTSTVVVSLNTGAATQTVQVQLNVN